MEKRMHMSMLVLIPSHMLLEIGFASNVFVKHVNNSEEMKPTVMCHATESNLVMQLKKIGKQSYVHYMMQRRNPKLMRLSI